MDQETREGGRTALTWREDENDILRLRVRRLHSPALSGEACPRIHSAEGKLGQVPVALWKPRTYRQSSGQAFQRLGMLRQILLALRSGDKQGLQ